MTGMVVPAKTLSHKVSDLTQHERRIAGVFAVPRIGMPIDM